MGHTMPSLTDHSRGGRYGRDRVIFSLLKSSDDSLRIEAMECLSLVPMANLQVSEVEELVTFVLDCHERHQVYVGRNEEQMVHAFHAFARLVRVPDRGLPRTAGFSFRREHADLVLLALELLQQNSARA